MLLQVDQKRADVTFAMEFDGDRYAAANPGTLDKTTKDSPVRIFPNCYMLKLGDEEFKNMLNTTLDELANQGYVEHLLAHYETYPGTLYPVARPYRKASLALSATAK